MSKFTFAAVAAVLCASGAITTPASAVVFNQGSSYTFSFTGVCSDCTGTASATLQLQNYVLGNSLQKSNIVSFLYDGTDLVDRFTIAGADVGTVQGNFSGLAGPQTFSLNGTANTGTFWVFQTNASGAWRLGVPNDFGAVSSWANVDAAVPEPATWGLMIAGFGLVGAAMRRRRTSIAFA